MPYSPDPEEWSNNDWVDREFIDYELEPHERRSLDAIQQNIREGAYKDPRNCYHHLELLEGMANKLKVVIGNERALGKANWDVEQVYKDVKELYQQLNEIHKGLRK
ncbi:hypothetical protein JXA12_05280 [Candidatus Woesearchaeota archaeon]|nr:hypothetical protein [Candidatus Woesearchaeota archaeon]